MIAPRANAAAGTERRADVGVRVAGLGKAYGSGATRVTALRAVTLTIDVGEFVAIMGPSGSGKSTLLHLLGGLDVPDAGTVVIAGHDLGAMSESARTVFRRRHVGVVFQCFNLVPTLSVEENVALPLRLDGRPRRDVQTRVAEALEQVGMLDRRGRWAPQLSGGEQQRVALARALAVDPLLILADEPTGSLDSRTAGEVLALLAAMSDRGRTVVMVTHDRDAAAHAGRIAHVVDGTIAELDRSRRCARGA
jgi:ABC-type lipoprotein export system ATPase subunit